MTEANRLLARYSLWMRQVEPYFVEILLAAVLAWAAKCLFLPPSNFSRYPNSFAILQSMERFEPFWGAIASTPAALQVLGIALLLSRRCHRASLVMRFVGLGTAAMFWLVLAVSFLAGDWDSISAGVMFMPALTALWILVRLPMLPGEPRCQRPL